MWKDYSFEFIKRNRASGVSVMVAAFISSLFLSFLCNLFYNFWVYEVERIVMEEGDWQGRLTGDITEEDMFIIGSFANVERAVVNEQLSGDQETTVDVYFENPRTIFRDLPSIAQRLGVGEDGTSYHLLLLSRYLIHDPQDETPPLLLIFYLIVLLAVSLSLILIIHNSFGVSMNSRIHQFGIFSSIGAAPGQIRTCLMQEAAVLCAVPVFLGNIAGIALCAGARQGMEAIARDIPGRHTMGFHYHPAVFFITVLISALTVFTSAWLPAIKISRLTPLEAIRSERALGLKRKPHSPALCLLFGIEGELAGNAIKSQKKTLRTATLSLTLSFLGFTTMLCLFSLMELSTKYTYFQRYQDVWDVMVTVKNTGIEELAGIYEMDQAEAGEDFVMYQKAEAVVPVLKESISPQLTALGGPQGVAGASISETEDAWRVKAPLVILDDQAFTDYCQQIGVTPRLDGTIVLNQIWDSINSVFRYPSYIPFVKEEQKTIVLENAGGQGGGAEIPVTAYTREVPVLKEEYADYTLVQFIPLSLWEEISGRIEGVKKDTYIRILAKEDVTLTELEQLEQHIRRQLAPSYETESENRIKDKMINDNIINGYKLVMGAFCVLLAMIGIANVYSYTFGFLRQRRREFARYMSVGLTPAGLVKMFCVEALVIAGRPILITLPLTYLFVEFSAKASFLDPMEVWPEIPVPAIGAFCLTMTGFVALAYYIGGTRVLNYSLVEALRDDTMV